MTHLLQKQTGLTLVELMIAMTLSLLLMAGAASMFLGSKKTFNVQEESARIQENMRYVVTRMINDISPAGFYGCAPSTQDGDSQIKSTVTSGDSLYTFDESITGVEGGGPNNSDSLTVRFAQSEFSLPVIGPMTTLDRAVHVDSRHPVYDELEQGDIIAVSDCGQLAAFMITNDPGADGRIEHKAGISIDGVSNTSEGTTHYFGGEPHSSATVIKMDAVTYDLGTTTNTQNTTTADDDTTTSHLYATRLGGNREQILSGVENFQVTYGIDDSDPPDSTSDRYVTWTTVLAETLQNRIASIHIALALNSGSPIHGTTGINQEFAENIEFTVKLRNRLADL